MKVHLKNMDPTKNLTNRFVHRLDHATSGCLCIAADKKTARAASKAFQNRTVTKHYLALVLIR